MVNDQIQIKYKKGWNWKTTKVKILIQPYTEMNQVHTCTEIEGKGKSSFVKFHCCTAVDIQKIQYISQQ